MALQLNLRDGESRLSRQALVILYHFLRLSTELHDLMICILIYQTLERPSSPEPKVEFQAYRKPNSSIII